MFSPDQFIGQCTDSLTCKLGVTTLATLVLGAAALIFIPVEPRLGLSKSTLEQAKSAKRPPLRLSPTIQRRAMMAASLLVWMVLIARLWSFFG